MTVYTACRASTVVFPWPVDLRSLSAVFSSRTGAVAEGTAGAANEIRASHRLRDCIRVMEHRESSILTWLHDCDHRTPVEVRRLRSCGSTTAFGDRDWPSLEIGQRKGNAAILSEASGESSRAAAAPGSGHPKWKNLDFWVQAEQSADDTNPAFDVASLTVPWRR
jgi:hypothetical protein